MKAESWCQANNKQLGKHLLYPRNKGFVACVQKLKEAPSVRAVYDVTIAYAKDGKLFQHPPTFTETLMVPRLDESWRFFVHLDRYVIEDLPPSEGELAQWLEQRWVEKGERLELLNQKLLKGESWDPL